LEEDIEYGDCSVVYDDDKHLDLRMKLKHCREEQGTEAVAYVPSDDTHCVATAAAEEVEEVHIPRNLSYADKDNNPGEDMVDRAAADDDEKGTYAAEGRGDGADDVLAAR
jgi:hypothetical protein